MQEGGDWTKELEDALERERESLKKLNQVELEKAKHQSSVSELQRQHSAVQTKLESALANAKMAAERERQAEDNFWSWICLDGRPSADKKKPKQSQYPLQENILRTNTMPLLKNWRP
jgi:septal ring factor EnvC (AmiA/AmiB activator)